MKRWICNHTKKCEYVKEPHNTCRHSKYHEERFWTCCLGQFERGQSSGICSHTYCVSGLENITKEKDPHMYQPS